MTKILCKIVGRDEELGGNTLKIGFPDENGQVVKVPFDADDLDAEGVTIGLCGTFSITPLVAVTHPNADPTATPNAAGLVPTTVPMVPSPTDVDALAPAETDETAKATAPVVVAEAATDVSNDAEAVVATDPTSPAKDVEDDVSGDE
jgi:hypothetical protein